jgi:hypothetical protein
VNVSGRGSLRGRGGFKDILFKRVRREVGNKGIKPRFLYIANQGWEWLRDGIQDNTSFSKNIKKSGPLIIGNKRLILVLVLA